MSFLRTLPRCLPTAAGGAFIWATMLLFGASAIAADTGECPQVFRHGTSELRFIAPYQAGKVPVVLVHGLFGSGDVWSRMIEKLSGNPAIRSRFQFLTFRYDSRSSILESGDDLALALDEARRRLDPTASDACFDDAILVGHSLGGLVIKAASLSLSPPRLDLLRSSPKVEPPSRGPRVGRFIFIATPHRGSTINRGAVRQIGRRLAMGSKRSTLAEPDASSLSSVDQLIWEHPILAELERSRAAAQVPFHSIIATLGDPSAEGAGDGAVPVESAKLAGARSELFLQTNHLCYHEPRVVDEVGRILSEQIRLLDEPHPVRIPPGDADVPDGCRNPTTGQSGEEPYHRKGSKLNRASDSWAAIGRGKLF